MKKTFAKKFMTIKVKNSVGSSECKKDNKLFL